MKKNLTVKASQTDSGVSLHVLGKEYQTIFPEKVWESTPSDVRSALFENLVFANTHFLPLLLGHDSITYNTPFPLLESFWYKNMLYDLIYCEKVDNQSTLTYLKHFYNLDFSFSSRQSSLPLTPIQPASQPTAVLPFTFGKESLVTLAMCLELGIKPLLLYSQEPIQPYEESHKKQVLKELELQYDLKAHFVKNDPGMFRYSGAFPDIAVSEVGWGTQTTLLALQSIPLAYAYGAEYIFIGSEISNNTEDLRDGWRLFPSYDQTSFWSTQQRNMVHILTANSVHMHSSLEPLEQIHIFYLLHHRYPELGKLQFSCSAKKPLLKDSQWCHQCYKCCRMYMYALCCDVDPKSIGFKQDLFQNEKLYTEYFGEDIRWGFPNQLGFNYHLLKRKKLLPDYARIYLEKHLPDMQSWEWYVENFNVLKSDQNLPPKFAKQLAAIFHEEMESFKKNVIE